MPVPFTGYLLLTSPGNAYTPWFETDRFNRIKLNWNQVNVSGTPTFLDVYAESSVDGGSTTIPFLQGRDFVGQLAGGPTNPALVQVSYPYTRFKIVYPSGGTGSGYFWWKLVDASEILNG